MKKYINISLVGMVALLMGGCKKFVDVNTNPNNAVSTKSQFVFTGALGNTYRNQVGGSTHIVPGTWTGFYAHSTSFTGGGNEKQYTFSNTDFNYFDGLYDNLADFQYVIDNGDKDGVGFWKDACNVMQCYLFQMLVDAYGNVPYSDAFKGIKNIAPKYDDQKTIYEDLVKRLDAAMTAISAATWPTAADVLQQDIYFQGNRDKWIRFANTLKLRILMRQSFMAGRDAYITTNINSSLARGYLTENVLCSPGYQNVAGKLNPYFAAYGYNEINAVQQNHSYRKMNAVIVNFLKNSLDTFRLQSLAWPAGSTVTTISSNLASYVGIPMGVGSGYATASSSAQGPFQIMQGQGTRPAIVVTLAESLLLQAEAAQRYAIVFPAGATPKALYEAGVTAHFRLCAETNLNQVTAVPNAAAIAQADPFAQRYLARDNAMNGLTTPATPSTAYAAGVSVFNPNWDASTDKLRTILVENWLAYCHVNGLAAWSEYRKSAPSASPSVPYSVRTVSPTSNPEPVRYFYPQSEEFANGTNVPPGINKFTSKIFWDAN